MYWLKIIQGLLYNTNPKLQKHDRLFQGLIPKTGYTPVIQHRWLENGPFEDVFPIENGDIPASYVSLLSLVRSPPFPRQSPSFWGIKNLMFSGMLDFSLSFSIPLVFQSYRK